jgi:transposase
MLADAPLCAFDRNHGTNTALTDRGKAKVAGMEEAIRAVGASLRYLPQYSPNLNPIELAFHPLASTWNYLCELEFLEDEDHSSSSAQDALGRVRGWTLG